MHALPETGLAVRPASVSDAAFVRQLAGSAFAEYDSRAAHTTDNMMLAAGAATLLAIKNDVPAGFIVLRRAGSVLAIDAIAVEPSERGKGIGQRLMRAAEQHARAEGLTRLTLSTAQSNLAALDLFLRLGFRITDRSTHYARRQPACKMEKRIR
jgi:ribosomal protein S18 acetylase RimI-like enzyme